MEIKVGEYVRTIDGVIAKLECIEEEYYFDNYIYREFEDDIYYLDTEQLPEYITKHSSKIIDLIELGDYVNGYLINYIPNNEKAIYHDASDCEDVEKFENKDIETIVTKEQFAEMEYEV